MSNERQPINQSSQPDHADPFRLRPSAQLARLRDASTELFSDLERRRVDLDAPVMPLAHLDTGMRLAEVVIRAATLIADLGLAPEFVVTLKIAELEQRETRPGKEADA